jgi:hypothetical protein
MRELGEMTLHDETSRTNTAAAHELERIGYGDAGFTVRTLTLKLANMLLGIRNKDNRTILEKEKILQA